MDKTNFDSKIEDVSKSILSYCIKRTFNREEAEDLAQDIITELFKSIDNIRNDEAFYSFMWSVAGKVYAMWCRKNSQKNKIMTTLELKDDLPDNENYFFDNENNDLYLLRRELTLLSKKYRRVVILYYFENKSCPEISSLLDISESMVKYLLFKARKILKDGINMERNYGELSYNPKNLSLMYMGEGPNKFWSITDGKILPQNILWACYNDNLTPNEISLQIGTSLPYIENEIKKLTESGLLLYNKGKYSTNIIIFTNDFKNEVSQKTKQIQENIADTIYNFIILNETKIRDIGFYMNDMSFNSFLWHMNSVIQILLFGNITKKYPFEEYPVTKFGDRAFVWGDESPRCILNICCMTKESELNEGEIRFLDYLPVPKGDHNLFFINKNLTNFYIKLASGKYSDLNEYEKELASELIKNGYLSKVEDKLSVTAPVYTRMQINTLYSILNSLIDEVITEVAKIQQITETILKNHIPLHLEQQAESIACMLMFDDVCGASTEIMVCKNYLKTYWIISEMPTVYIITD